MKRLLMGLLLCLTLAVMPVMAQSTDDGEELRQWAVDADGTSQYGSNSWSFLQATGEPDTFQCGDIATAWASASSTGEDTLVLSYAQAVVPTQINIYQTYNPGAIVSVEVSNSSTGESAILPDSADPLDNTPCPGVFTVDVDSVDFTVDTVAINLDQSITNSWNEIDAVELVGIGTGSSASTVIDETPALDDEGFVGIASNLTITVPEGWVFEEVADSTFVASTQAALEFMRDTDGSGAPEAGSVAINLLPLPNELLASVGIATDLSLSEFTATFTELIGFGGVVEDYDVLGIPAALQVIEPGEDMPDNATLIVTAYPDGYAGWAIQHGQGDEFTDYIDEINEVIASLRYEGVPVYDVADADSAEDETASSDSQLVGFGGLQVVVPEGWASEESFDAAFLATSATTLALLREGNNSIVPDSGEIAISLLPVNDQMLGELGLEPISTVEELLAQLIGLFGFSGEVISYDDLDFPAAIMLLEAGLEVPENAILMITAYPDGFVFWAIQYGQGDAFEDYTDIITEVVSSLLYEGVPVYAD